MTQNCDRQTIFVVMFIAAINVYIFAIGYDKTSPLTMIPYDVLNGHIWQVWTATFIHIDLNHLSCNMVTLLVFGTVVQQRIGYKKFVVLYTISGIISNTIFVLLSIIGYTDSSSICLGASGCILGLVGASPMCCRRIKILWVVSIGAALAYVYQIVTGGRGSEILHLAGLTSGMILILYLRKSDGQKNRRGY